MKIGVPKALYYYYIEEYILFLKKLGVTIVSYETDKEIINKGLNYGDEMCLSLKIFLGHVAALAPNCDYILIPNIKNYGRFNQMCVNFQSLYNLVSNLFDVKILTYEIDYLNKKFEYDACLKIGRFLGFTDKKIKSCYREASIVYKSNLKSKIMEQENKLNSKNKKILVVAHPYNIYDKYVGKPIIDYLESMNVELIYSFLFDPLKTNLLSNYVSSDLYWKYSKENLGSIVLCKEKIDGILFFTTFPCGLDSFVNELAIRKIKKPYLNLIVDDMDGLTGFITRLESFVDIIEQA